MSWIRLFTILFIGVLLIGCSRSQSNEERLKRAEQIVENSPYEAADILDSIEPSKLGRKQRADFEILRGEIRYRLDSVMVGGDSLLGIATDYYDTQLENPKNSRAHFLRAYELQSQGRRPEAIVELFHAERSAAGAGDTLALGLIYRSISDYFRQMEDNGTALTYAQKAYEMFSAIQSDKYTPWALYDLARAYGNVFNHRKAIEILERCIDENIYGENKFLKSEVIIFLAQQYNYIEEYSKAIKVYNSYLADSLLNLTPDLWLNMGLNYLCLKDLEHAVVCQDSLDKYDSSEYYLKMSIADYKRDYEDFYNYIKIGVAEQNDVLIKVYKRDYSSVINNYFINQIEKSEAKRAFEKVVRYVIISLVFIVLCIIFFYVRKYKQKRKLEIENNIASIKMLEETIANNTIFINELSEEKQAQLSKTRSILAALLSSRINEAEILCRDYDSVPTDKKQQKLYKRLSEILSEIKVGSDYIKDLENTVNHIMNNIMIDFRMDYPDLTEKEYCLFLFIVLGFSTNICCFSQNVTPGHYYKMKSQLKKKIINSGTKAERYLKYF